MVQGWKNYIKSVGSEQSFCLKWCKKHKINMVFKIINH